MGMTYGVRPVRILPFSADPGGSNLFSLAHSSGVLTGGGAMMSAARLANFACEFGKLIAQVLPDGSGFAINDLSLLRREGMTKP